MTVAHALRRGLGSAALALAALTWSPHPCAGVTPFSITTLDPVANSGYTVSMVVDANGDPHIAYIQFPTPLVRYAHRSGGIWSLEDIGPGKQFPDGVSIALDGAGTPHVAFMHDPPSGPDEVRLAVRTPSGWDVQTVDTGRLYLDLAIDGSDRLHLVYRQDPASQRYRLRYARRSGPNWLFETADTGYVFSPHASNFEHVSLALDPDGEPAITFHTGVGDRKLGFARRVAETWVVDEPDPTGCGGFLPDVRFDELGAPAVSFLAGYAGEMRVAKSTPGGWEMTTVDPESWAPDQCFAISYNSSLVFDPEGRGRLSYGRIDPSGLVFAAEVAGSWVHQLVDPTSDAGMQSALALTLDGRPMIAYGSTLGLRFAEATGPIVGVTPVVPRDGFALSAPAPNPVASGRELGLRFALPREDRVAVSVTDVAGRRVWSSPARTFAAGDQSLDLDLPRVAPGVYFVRLAADAHGERVARFVVLD